MHRLLICVWTINNGCFCFFFHFSRRGCLLICLQYFFLPNILIGTVHLDIYTALVAMFQIRIRNGTASRKANMTHKKRNFTLWSAGCPFTWLFLSLGFSFYLEARHGGLSIKVFFFRKFYFFSCSFTEVWSSKSGSGSGFTKTPGPGSVNPDRNTA